MSVVFLSNIISAECRHNIEEMGYKTVLLPPYGKLPAAIGSHADTLLFYDGDRLALQREYYESNRELFCGIEAELLLCNEKVGSSYPYDIPFNCVLTSEGTLFSKTEYTSNAVKRLAKKTVNVNQGYVACSTCRVGDKAFITADKGLYKAYTENGIDCLKITEGHIDLPGYGFGFIGGASAVLGDTVGFFGKIEDHPDYLKIKEFIAGYGKKAVSLSREKLTDIGGAVVTK